MQVPLQAVGWVVAVAALAVGTAIRLWLLYHLPFTSDEAVVGLMARRISHGQMFTFYWGQSYGGVEPYLLVVWSAVVGSGPVALNALPVVLSAVAAVLAGRITLRMVDPSFRFVAWAVAAALWVWPDVVAYNSARELGFRGVTVVAGLAAVLLAMRVRTRPTIPDAVGLGLALGIGWWSSPEIVYFAVPVAVIVVIRRIGLTRWLVIAASGLIGALPWLATNLATGFASLRESSSPEYVHRTYGGRLSVFAHDAFPMMLGLRLPLSGAWLWGRAGQALYVLAVIVIVAAVAYGWFGRSSADLVVPVRALAWGVLVFPFIFAAFPATSFWQQGQYGVFIVPLVAALVTAALTTGLFRVGVPSWVTPALIVVLVTAIGASSFDRAWLGGHRSFTSGWHGLPVAMQEAVAGVRASGVRFAYAQYWVAYDLDYLDRRLVVADPYTDRWVGQYQEVRRSADPAWIFYAPDQHALGATTFSSGADGPYGYPEALFLSKLAALDDPYRVVHAGVLDVVFPLRNVTQEQVGIPSAYWP